MPDQRFSSNTSSDSTRYASSNRSASESRNPIYGNQSQQSTASGVSNSNGNGSNRNSLKEIINSNRSSMDVSTCSYNTLIIHNDEGLYSSITGNRLGNEYQLEQDGNGKGDRSNLYGGEQGMQEITEIPDDYLNKSHVLKHLAKEIKIPNNRPKVSARETSSREPPKYEQWAAEEQNEQNNSKVKSKSQPDLTK